MIPTYSIWTILGKSTLHFNQQVHVHVHIIYEQGEHNPQHYIKDPASHIHLKDIYPKDFYDVFSLDTTSIPEPVMVWKFVTQDNTMN